MLYTVRGLTQGGGGGGGLVGFGGLGLGLTDGGRNSRDCEQCIGLEGFLPESSSDFECIGLGGLACIRSTDQRFSTGSGTYM